MLNPLLYILHARPSRLQPPPHLEPRSPNHPAAIKAPSPFRLNVVVADPLPVVVVVPPAAAVATPDEVGVPSPPHNLRPHRHRSVRPTLLFPHPGRTQRTRTRNGTVSAKRVCVRLGEALLQRASWSLLGVKPGDGEDAGGGIGGLRRWCRRWSRG